jgi:hypothetical protein
VIGAIAMPVLEPVSDEEGLAGKSPLAAACDGAKHAAAAMIPTVVAPSRRTSGEAHVPRMTRSFPWLSHINTGAHE